MANIENIEIRFSGSANFKEVYAEAARLNAQLRTMQAELAKVDGKGLRDLRSAFNTRVQGAGGYATEAVKAKSATQAFTESLVKQEVTVGKAIKQRGLLNDVIREQYLLQKMTAVQWAKTAGGTISADVIVPKNSSEYVDRLTKSTRYNTAELLKSRWAMRQVTAGTTESIAAGERFSAAQQVMRARMAVNSDLLRSFSSNMVKWGKNTQWAGRQLMVGFAVPFLAFSAVAGIAANNVDKEMTRILKVYDFSAEAVNNSALREAESNRVRSLSLDAAKQSAIAYGVSMKDTLEIEAELAATGMTGNDLVQRTVVLNKAIIAGEIDKQQALKASTAMQTVYGYSTEQVNQGFEYMQTLSNATSVSVSDFVDALPRAGQVLKNAGVGIKDMGVLLVALKQSGIEAGEGVNGLRTITQRLVAVTPKAEKVWKALLPEKKSIQDIVDANNGQLVPSLKGISAAMKELSVYDREKIFTELFGKNRMNIGLSVADALSSETNQMKGALKAANMSVQETSQIAANALAQVTNSASGKIKRAIETIKAELAGLGATFLPLAATFMGWVGGLLAGLNALSDGKKKMLMFAGAGIAVISGLVMMVGLFSNLIGTVSGFIVWLSTLRLKFRTQTLEQKAEALMADSTAAAWRNQGLAAQTLSSQLQRLTRSLGELTMVQTEAAAAQSAGVMNGGVYGRYSGTSPRYQGAPVVTHTDANTGARTTVLATETQNRAARNMAHGEALAMNEERVAAASTVTKRNWAGIAGSTAAVAMAGTMIAGSMGDSDSKTKNIMANMTNILMTATLLGPTLGKAFASVKGMQALSNMKGAYTAGRMGGRYATELTGIRGVVAGLQSAIAAGGTLVSVIAKFAGPVGLLVGGALAVKSIHDGMEEARKKQIQLNESAKDWSKILGFTYTNAATEQKGKSSGEKAASLAGKFRSANAEAMKGLDIAKKTNNQEELINLAIQEGVKARMHGADAGQARLAVETALAATGKSDAEVKGLMVNVDAQIDFSNMEAVAQKQGATFGKMFSDAFNGGVKSDHFLTRMWEDVRGGLTSGAQQAAADAGKEFWNGFDSSQGAQAKKAYFEGVEADFKSRTADLMKRINNDKEFKAANSGAGNFTWDNIADWTNNPNGAEAGLFDSGLPKKYTEEVKNAAQAERTFVQTMATQRGLSPSVIKGLSTMADLHKVLGIASETTTSATAQWQEEMARAAGHGVKLSEAEKLQILNKWRLKAGLDNATESAQGFGGALQGASGAVDQFGAAIDSNIMTAEEWGAAWGEATKTAMAGAQDMALSQAEALRSDQTTEIMDGIAKKYADMGDRAQADADAKAKAYDARGKALDKKYDREGKALDERQKARQKAVADSYDNRIKKVQDAIDAEAKAEEERQRIFEAEKTRLERLAAMKNANIDFNVAINTGSLDEAAKLFNNMQSQQDSWAIDDATAGSSNASDTRKAAKQNQIDGINKSKDAALESLKKREDAEKEALKAKQDREKEALDAEKERYAKGLDANKKKLAADEAAEKTKTTAEIERRKHALDMEIMAIRASTPRNKAEYDYQIRAIQNAYNRYGLDLKAKGQVWTGYIGDYLTANIKTAAASMKNDINWKAYAAEITDKFMNGAFNMDIAEFGNWIRTGKAPNDAFQKPKLTVNSTQAGAHGAGGSHEVKHEGGLLGGSNNSRKGYARGSGTYPSEINLLAQKGEYVVQKKAVNTIGTDVLDSINKGEMPMGGANLGLAGIVGGGLAGMVRNAMQMGALTGAMRQLEASNTGATATIGKNAGTGGIKLSGDQLRNAQSILATGKGLGASKRDMTIALMTAMQESMLHNIPGGDRDSVGLFQQRPSQGWGTVEQIMNPQYSATKFYKELFKVKGRDQMPMTLAAQAVQRSAFPMAYAKWQPIAESLVNGTTFTGGTGMGLEEMLKELPMMQASGVGIGKGGRPIDVGKYRVSSEYGMRVNPVTGVYKLHDGIDLAAAAGTPIHSIKNGTVLHAGTAGGYGNYTVIQHSDGTQSGYAHQSRLNVRSGQMVTAGQLIGAVGTTGNSTGNHLHFQMGHNGNWENPRNFIPGLAKGGYTLNDGYAMLHKNETVLTADLSEKLNAGLNNLANGDTNKYTISVDMRGSNFSKEMDVEALIEKGVTTALNKHASKMGRDRKVNA